MTHLKNHQLHNALKRQKLKIKRVTPLAQQTTNLNPLAAVTARLVRVSRPQQPAHHHIHTATAVITLDRAVDVTHIRLAAENAMLLIRFVEDKDDLIVIGFILNYQKSNLIYPVTCGGDFRF
jgi:hypothetical protein